MLRGGDRLARMDLDMTEGNIWMHMLRFSVPMAIGLLYRRLRGHLPAVRSA